MSESPIRGALLLLIDDQPGGLVDTPREQLYQGRPIARWPADEAYVRALVHDWEFTDGSFRMVRWSGPSTISLGGDLGEAAVRGDPGLTDTGSGGSVKDWGKRAASVLEE